MKTILYSMLLMVFCMPFTINAQQINENDLIGSWVFDDATSFNNLSEETFAHFSTIPTAEVENIKNLYINRKITFGSDGSYVQVLDDGRTIGGIWKFDATKNVITITHPSGGQSVQTVKHLKKNQLLLVPLTSGKVKMLVSQSYFIKL